MNIEQMENILQDAMDFIIYHFFQIKLKNTRLTHQPPDDI